MHVQTHGAEDNAHHGMRLAAHGGSAPVSLRKTTKQGTAGRGNQGNNIGKQIISAFKSNMQSKRTREQQPPHYWSNNISHSKNPSKVQKLQ